MFYAESISKKQNVACMRDPFLDPNMNEQTCKNGIWEWMEGSAVGMNAKNGMNRQIEDIFHMSLSKDSSSFLVQ